MRTWGIRLGSGGCCIPFCEKHSIVGIGWQGVHFESVRDQNLKALRESGLNGHAIGTLSRFADVEQGDYVLYYNPNNKMVTLAKITSDLKYRDFDVDNEAVDIWFFRKVEICRCIRVLDFDATLKWSVLGPRGSFWLIESQNKEVSHADLLAQNLDPHSQKDENIQCTYDMLRNAIKEKMEVLNEREFEILVADYMVFNGILVTGKIGGNKPIIDVEGTGPFGQLWRAQAKKENGQVSWDSVEAALQMAGGCNFIYASFNGFTEEVRIKLEDVGDIGDVGDIRLIEADDFVDMIIAKKCREEIMNKIRWY